MTHQGCVIIHLDSCYNNADRSGSSSKETETLATGLITNVPGQPPTSTEKQRFSWESHSDEREKKKKKHAQPKPPLDKVSNKITCSNN